MIYDPIEVEGRMEQFHERPVAKSLVWDASLGTVVSSLVMMRPRDMVY
jgi:hypothetical protein